MSNQAQENNNDESGSPIFSIDKHDLVLLIIAVFLPPVAVWKRRGFFSKDSLLNVLLFLLFFFPAVIHAMFVIHETSLQRSRGQYQQVSSNDNSNVAVEEQNVNKLTNVHDLEENRVPPLYNDIVKSPMNVSDNKIQNP
ncbi:hypothetical protein Kpol_2002p82 [Vanderwaltozyma polyspora DSM 70294]|uniref:Uncharacterized protein n=1 Tax=Vanderwaltozyma polyspora (strain ATCC 22028 / DSM 70294 / BCRC 21397 / CBS 2163 / NBRC 10782 / NRRL Y-8283 / UCD 57-17) TaxID=436907 RepID=A7TFJ7_VANPO|nr:uncharacterized protein Kpol_2002p82 [Vanderwaltozyma polyspora DSM 70294]EDO19011.1 hypothetical protein Kpol_2002p82 [Vanderwaltozyma polyspora DSM 70294]